MTKQETMSGNNSSGQRNGLVFGVKALTNINQTTKQKKVEEYDKYLFDKICVNPKRFKEFLKTYGEEFREFGVEMERKRILEGVEKMRGVKEIVDTNPNYPEFDIKQMKSCFMIDREEVKQIIKG